MSPFWKFKLLKFFTVPIYCQNGYPSVASICKCKGIGKNKTMPNYEDAELVDEVCQLDFSLLCLSNGVLFYP